MASPPKYAPALTFIVRFPTCPARNRLFHGRYAMPSLVFVAGDTASFSHHIYAGSTCRRLLHAVLVDIIHRTYIISYSIVLPLNHFLETFLAVRFLFLTYGPDRAVLLDCWACAQFLQHAPIPQTGSGRTNQPNMVKFIIFCARVCLHYTEKFVAETR